MIFWLVLHYILGNYWPRYCASSSRLYCRFFFAAGVTSTLIALVLKIINPSSFVDFCPISLCTFLSKVISKLLARRLEPILWKIINPQQSAFVKERLIIDNVLLAHELITSISKKKRGTNIALKLDMAKTHLRVSWAFSIRVM